MQHFFRLIALLLALSTGGVFDALAFADGEGGCAADRTAEAPCGDDCDDDCSGGDDGSCCACVCCPSRVPPAAWPVAFFEDVPVPDVVLTVASDPVIAQLCADIFQPPRA